jgi:hypothetical protein
LRRSPLTTFCSWSQQAGLVAKKTDETLQQSKYRSRLVAGPLPARLAEQKIGTSCAKCSHHPWCKTCTVCMPCELHRSGAALLLHCVRPIAVATQTRLSER